MVTEQDRVAAEAVTEWFGAWWAARPMQLVAVLSLAKLAALAVEGDSNARHLLLEGDLTEMIGIGAAQARTISENSMSVFFAAATEGSAPSAATGASQAAEAALDWAARWERHCYTQ